LEEVRVGSDRVVVPLFVVSAEDVECELVVHGFGEEGFNQGYFHFVGISIV
jgi:hypothetical protein